MRQPMNRMTGFSLTEVLVAMLVLAIGLLGLAALQIAGVRSNQTAYYRSIATQLAYDIADRMRANPVGVAAGLYNNNKGTPGTSLTQKCDTASCKPDDLAAYDLNQWAYALNNNLPNGSGIVCSITSAYGTPLLLGDSSASCSGSVGNVYVVKVWWNDDRSGSKTQGFVTSFQLGN